MGLAPPGRYRSHLGCAVRGRESVLGQYILCLGTQQSPASRPWSPRAPSAQNDTLQGGTIIKYSPKEVDLLDICYFFCAPPPQQLQIILENHLHTTYIDLKVHTNDASAVKNRQVPYYVLLSNIKAFYRHAKQSTTGLHQEPPLSSLWAFSIKAERGMKTTNLFR